MSKISQTSKMKKINKWNMFNTQVNSTRTHAVTTSHSCGQTMHILPWSSACSMLA